MSYVAPRPPRVLVFSLGGTIAMSGERGAGVVPQLDASALLETVPELRHQADLVVRSFRQLPGAHLQFSDIRALATEIEANGRQDGPPRVVVTQGTDTIEETAFALDLLVDTRATIVVTGSMRHASQPGFEGPANLLDAVCVASSEGSEGMGTLVVLNGEIHAARYVRKAHSFQSNAFVSVVGPLGWVSERRPHFALRPQRATLPLQLSAPVKSSRVAVVPASLGDDGALVQAVPDLGYDGLVIEALGAGHVPAAMVATLEEVSRRIPVVLSSRTGGPVLTGTYGFPGSERDLLSRGLIGSAYLGSSKARVLLMLLLDSGADLVTVREAFRQFAANGAAL